MPTDLKLVQLHKCTWMRSATPSALVIQKQRMLTTALIKAKHPECAVCWNQEKNTVLQPCNHYCVCSDCAVKVRRAAGKCPICRSPIVATQRVFG